MKRITAFLILIILFLFGCSQKEVIKDEKTMEKNEVSSSEIDYDKTSNDNMKVQTGLLFNNTVADPQDMSPVFDAGTCSVKAELFKYEDNNYKGDIFISREKPQTGYKEGFIKLEYSGILRGGNDLEPEVKEALNKMAGVSIKEGSIYGKIDVNIRTIDRRFVEFPNFLETMDYVNSNASDGEIPFLLSIEKDKAELYLYFHQWATLKVEGEIKPISTDKVKRETDFSADAIYINDRAMSSESDGIKQIYRVLFLGKKKEDTRYTGHLLYSMNEEQTITKGVVTKGEKTKFIEKDIDLIFESFDENKYRDNGGTKFAGRMDKVSHMSILNCEGQNFIFTTFGDDVFVELTNTTFKGFISGEFTELSDEISIIADESFEMYRAQNDYYSTGDNSKSQSNEIIDNAMAGINQSGIKLTEEQLEMMEAAITTMGQMPNGQSKWLPEGFIPMESPMDGDFMEQPPTTVYGGNFQYQEDNLMIDDILPNYVSKFSKLRNYKEKGGVVDGHKYHEMVFRYGEELVFIEFTDNAAGASVSVLVY